MAITTKQQRRNEALQLIMDARQLGFAGLLNQIPTKTVVVLDLTTKRFFPLLGGHGSGRGLL